MECLSLLYWVCWGLNAGSMVLSLGFNETCKEFEFNCNITSELIYFFKLQFRPVCNLYTKMANLCFEKAQIVSNKDSSLFLHFVNTGAFYQKLNVFLNLQFRPVFYHKMENLWFEKAQNTGAFWQKLNIFHFFCSSAQCATSTTRWQICGSKRLNYNSGMWGQRQPTT